MTLSTGLRPATFVTKRAYWQTSERGLSRTRRVYPPTPYEIIGFGDIHGPKPYKFIRFGDIHGPKPYKSIRFGDVRGPKPSTKHRVWWIASDRASFALVLASCGPCPTWLPSLGLYPMLRHNASRQEIGLPDRIPAGF